MKWYLLLFSILCFMGGEKTVGLGLMGGMIFTGWLWFSFVNGRIKKNQEANENEEYEEVIIRRKKKS